jgi:hydrogenase maturation factor
VDNVQPGEYVLVHVGFGLARLDEAEANRVFELLHELDELGELQADSE